MSEQYNPIDLTAESITLLRRIRAAAMQETNADDALADTSAIADAVGSMLVAGELGQDITDYSRNVIELLKAEGPKYAAYEPLSRKDRNPLEMAQGLAEDVEHFNDAVTREYFELSPRGGGRALNSWRIASEIDEYPAMIAPIASDILRAVIRDKIVRHHFGRGFEVIPAATDPEGARAVLPSDIAFSARGLRIYLDAIGQGVTQGAIQSALRERGIEDVPLV